MSQKDKLIKKLCSHPKDFSLNEAETLLRYLGYHMDNKGKTSGSRISFINSKHSPILLHRPHPGNQLRDYQIKQLIDYLKQEDLI